MASSSLPEEFWLELEPLLPPDEAPGEQGGRPRVLNKTAMRGIFFVLLTGIRWEYLPREIGCCGMTCWRRLKAWQELEIWDQLHRLLLAALRKAGKLDLSLAVVDSTSSRAVGGGESTGPKPDRPQKTRHQTASAGGPQWRSPGDPCHRGQSARRPRDHPPDREPPADRRQAGPASQQTQSGAGGPGLPQPRRRRPPEVAGHHAGNCQTEHAARKRPGQDPLGSRTHHRLDPGIPTTSYPLRPH